MNAQGGGTPTRDQVREKVAALISEIAGVPLPDITETATVDEQLQMPSVTFIELQVAIEEEYNIQIDPIQVVELNQFGAIVDYVHQRTARSA